MKIIAVMLMLLLAACASNPAPTATPLPPTDAPEAEMDNATPTPEMAAQAEATSTPAQETAPPEDAARPAWQTIQLTNARTGETFTLADYAGKTVYVEPMATWCTNCRAQMNRVIPVYDALGNDGDYAFVSLSVGESVSDQVLADYADREGFDWIFAVAPPDMLAELTNAFGRAALTPPSTPHFLIYPDGTDSGLKTGPESTDDLRAAMTGV
ncbi:MAG: hypothetical protein CL610_29295 [Anaerolineaceae bacterium]|nr:hypothetical protein [Anaerolineaceae bacterium]